MDFAVADGVWCPHTGGLAFSQHVRPRQRIGMDFVAPNDRPRMNHTWADYLWEAQCYVATVHDFRMDFGLSIELNSAIVVVFVAQFATTAVGDTVMAPAAALVFGRKVSRACTKSFRYLDCKNCLVAEELPPFREG